jgi:hypothetical protein
MSIIDIFRMCYAPMNIVQYAPLKAFGRREMQQSHTLSLLQEGGKLHYKVIS